MILLAVALGGFVGAPCRYLADRAVSSRTRSELPWGTLFVNLSGAFLLGLLAGLSLSGRVSSTTSGLVGTGYLGAFTTFSTFSFETVRLLERGEYLRAGGYVAASLGVGLAAAAAGVALGLR